MNILLRLANTVVLMSILAVLVLIWRKPIRVESVLEPVMVQGVKQSVLAGDDEPVAPITVYVEDSETLDVRVENSGSVSV